MRFFAKFVFTCNICFILSVLLRMVEMHRKVNGSIDGVIYQPVEGSVVIIGFLLAIFFNAFFALFCIYWILAKKIKVIPRWILLGNLLLLPVQVWYLIFFK